MTNKLRQYFPMIHTRQEVLAEIEAKPKLKQEFYSWGKKYRKEFLDFCTGVKGVKIMPPPHPEFRRILLVKKS